MGAASREEAVCGENRELGLEVFMGTCLGSRDARVNSPGMRRGLWGKMRFAHVKGGPGYLENHPFFRGQEVTGNSTGANLNKQLFHFPQRGCMATMFPDESSLHMLTGLWPIVHPQDNSEELVACVDDLSWGID